MVYESDTERESGSEQERVEGRRHCKEVRTVHRANPNRGAQATNISQTRI